MPFYSMADSRAFTDYQSSCQTNNALMLKYNLKNNHEFRKYMQLHGNEILKELDSQTGDGFSCKSCPVCGNK